MALRASELRANQFSEEQLNILKAVGVTYDRAGKPGDDRTGRLRLRTGPSSSRWLSVDEAASMVNGDGNEASEDSIPVIDGYMALPQGIPREGADGGYSKTDMFYLAALASKGVPRAGAEHVKARKALESIVSAASANTPEQFAMAYLQFNNARLQQGESPVYASEFARLSVREAEQMLVEARAKTVELKEAVRRSLLHAQELKSPAADGSALAAAVNANYVAETIAKFTSMLNAIAATSVSGNGLYSPAPQPAKAAASA